MKNLDKVIKKYKGREYNKENYNVGGGLDGGKYASRRHEDALIDKGKLTFGKAVQMFKKATWESLEKVKEIVKYAVPNMEWHHAGMLPKRYGGGMKKTYFLNADEITDIAENWTKYYELVAIRNSEERDIEFKRKMKEAKKQDYLQKKATPIERTTSMPKYFYETNREMNGKYGWFCSYGKTYNMTEYYTGWKFETQEDLDKFYSL